MSQIMDSALLNEQLRLIPKIDMSLFNMHDLHVRTVPEYLGYMVIEIVCKVTDAVDDVGAPNMGLAFVERIPAQYGSGTLPTPKQIRAVILKLMEHEVDECLRINGLQLIDPHANEKRSYAQK